MIKRPLLERLYREARNSYPAECCGWIQGPSSGASELRPCANLKKGKAARTAFEFAGNDLLALNKTLDTDRPALMIYHSHTNGRAYLSEADRREALSPSGDAPLYPVLQLVIGLDASCIREACLFSWSKERLAFVELQVFSGAAL